MPSRRSYFLLALLSESRGSKTRQGHVGSESEAPATVKVTQKGKDRLRHCLGSSDHLLP